MAKKKNQKVKLAKGIDAYVTDKEIKLLEKIAESPQKFLKNMSTLLLNEYTVLRYKNITDFNIVMDLNRRIKKFIQEFKENIIPSPGLQLFFIMMQLEQMLVRYFGIPSKLKEHLLKIQSGEKDFNTFLKEVEESLVMSFQYDPCFTEGFKKKIKPVIDCLGTALSKAYKYNEWCFNAETLEKDLESKLTAYREQLDLTIDFKGPQWYQEEGDFYKEAKTRLDIVLALSEQSFNSYRKTLPEQAPGDIKYIKGAITRTGKLLAEHLKLIQTGDEK